MNKAIWKEIPGFSNYEASDEGHVRKKDTKKNIKEYLNGWDPNDPYLSVSVNGKTVMLHHLVCLAFHGDPGPGYEANHKDGNKLNSIPANLEWTTHSENVIHAYATKLNRSSQHIDVTDLRTGNIVHLRSLKHFAQHFGLGQDYNKSILAPRNQPWLGHYQIDLHPDYKQSNNKGWRIDVKDYTTGEVHTGISLLAAGKLTGLLRKTVRLRLVNKSLELTNGCVVKFSTDNTSWPVYNDKEIIRSIAEFKRTALRVKNEYALIDCFDYKTNTLYVGVNLNFLEKELGLARPTVRRLVNRNMLKLIKGCVVKRHGGSAEFPVTTPEMIQRSIDEAVNRSVNNHRRHK